MAVTTYSTIADLRVGDIRLPARYGDGTAFVEAAAEEIDAQLGHIYVTPFVIPAEPSNRPAILLLKKINNLIASGRLILDLAASGEDDALHAYGASMLREGLKLLGMIQSREVVLTGAELVTDGDGEASPTGPMIFNEDGASLVQGFYTPSFSPLGIPAAPWPGPYSNKEA